MGSGCGRSRSRHLGRTGRCPSTPTKDGLAIQGARAHLVLHVHNAVEGAAGGDEGGHVVALHVSLEVPRTMQTLGRRILRGEIACQIKTCSGMESITVARERVGTIFMPLWRLPVFHHPGLAVESDDEMPRL